MGGWETYLGQSSADGTGLLVSEVERGVLGPSKLLTELGLLIWEGEVGGWVG